MILYQKLATLMNHYPRPWRILDLWAGDGRYSIFCASYGHRVTAIDNESKENWLWPEYLLNHPNISFIKWDIRELPENILKEKYDIILIFNVIVFLKKKFFLETLLPQYLDLLKKWGILCLTFFFADDEDMSKNQLLSFYSFEDFSFDEKKFSVNKEEFHIKENHAPIGEHTHHIGYLEIRKN